MSSTFDGTVASAPETAVVVESGSPDACTISDANEPGPNGIEESDS